MGVYYLPLNGCKAQYKNLRDYHVVEFICLNSDCIFSQNPNKYQKSIGFVLLTKKACYDFINLIAEIKQALIQN